MPLAMLKALLQLSMQLSGSEATSRKKRLVTRGLLAALKSIDLLSRSMCRHKMPALEIALWRLPSRSCMNLFRSLGTMRYIKALSLAISLGTRFNLLLSWRTH